MDSQRRWAFGNFCVAREVVYGADNVYESDLAVISKTYSYAVFTMNSAFYYHGLTDTIPRSYYLMTDKASTKIKDKRVCQDIVLKAISQSTLSRNVTIKGGVVMNNYVY